MANDELYTPKWVFDGLGVEFDLDVASSDNDNIVVPAKKRYTIQDNALIQDWHGLVWCNPPYSKPSPWVDKWLNHGNGFLLTPLGGNGRWLQNLWDAPTGVICMQPKMNFITPQGKPHNTMYRIALWAIGDENINTLKKSGLGTVR